MKKIHNSWVLLPPTLKKLIMELKIAIMIVLLNVTNIFASETFSQTAKVSLDVTNKTLEQVMDEIEQQSEFYFIFNQKQIDVNRNVSILVENKQITDILPELFMGTNVNYAIVDRKILLTTDPLENNLFPASLGIESQQNRITGTVTGKDGAPLPGVNVVVTGTTVGTITDISGNYIIDVPQGSKSLTFSFVGMVPQEVAIETLKQINVTLTESAIDLDEVVVIGYGIQKKVTLTGSVALTKGEEIVKSHTANVLNSVIGQLPGVIINTRTGEPGRDNPTVFIRGRSTTGTTTPLVIVDGVARDILGKLNPNDIETITVLKDASAAIYGARAANGVILVTTKRGKEGSPTFNFSYNQGFSQPTRKVKMADSYTFAKVWNEIEVREGRSPKYSEAELQKFKDGTDPNYPNTDWYDFITKTFTPQHRTNLSASGGTKNVNYYVSIGEQGADGQFEYGSLKTKQYNLRSNIEVSAGDVLKIGLDIAGRYDDNHYPYQSTSNLYSHIFLYHPTWTPFWPGTNFLTPGRDSENIINWVSDNAGTNKDKHRSIESTLQFSLTIPWVSGLSIGGSANWDGGYSYNKTFRLPTYVYYKNSTTGELYEARAGSGVNQATLAETFYQNTTFTVNTKINYDRSFGKHNIGLMFGYEQMKYRYDNFYAFRSDFPSTALDILNAGSSDKSKHNNSGTASELSRLNYFGRATYDFANKYLAQFIFRYDGSPNFPTTKRWGFFPGVSLGWRISEEPFMSNIEAIDNLKIRASYGEMGNDAVSAFQYLMAYSYGSNYVLGNSDVVGLVQSGTPNPNITWEVAKTTNFGIESTLWKGLLGIEFDVFKTRRSNILTKRNAVVPDYTGLTLPDENIGIVDNKGFELQLSHKNTVKKLIYSLNGNFSFARNKVVFADEAPAAEEYQLATGRPIGSTLRYHAIGIFKDIEEINGYPHFTGAVPGDIKYEDTNKDGVLNSRDQIRINETAIPEIVYAFNASLEYKNFDLSVLFQGQANAQVYFGSYYQVMSYSLGNFTQWREKDHWSPTNTDATMPRASIELWNNNANNVNSDHWQIDSDFLRLKNLELGYSLPSSITNKMKIQNFRVYASGNNLLILFDHMKEGGFDPETTSYWWYPQQRVINVGVSLTF